MKTSHNGFGRRLGWLAGAVAVAAVSGAAPGWAQDSVPCAAFARNSAGGWQVLDPVMLQLNGRLYSPTVGTIFPAGATQHGVEMSDVLDQRCGNR